MDENNQKSRIFFGSINVKKLSPQVHSLHDGNKNKEMNDETKEEVLEFSKHAQDSLIRKQKLQDDMDKRRRAKQVILPTSDNLIKMKFRELGEPIILFGEKPENRRERLKSLLLDRNLVDGYPISERKKQEEKKQQYQQEQDFLTVGTEELKQCRINIAKYSLERASQRLQTQKRKREAELQIQEENKQMFEEYQQKLIERQQKLYKKAQLIQQKKDENNDVNMVEEDEEISDIPSNLPFKLTEYENELIQVTKDLKNYYPSLSQIGDEKISSVGFSPDSKMVATTSWGGMLKLWDVDGRERLENQYSGHKERINNLSFHPQSTLSQGAGSVNIATASCDQTCKLWSLESSTPLAVLSGHLGYVNRVCFHPMGRYIATSSSDRSWRLWDIESQQVLLDQEGHSEAILGISIQCDGSLIASGGQDSLCRIWDLRSGKPVQHHQGHSKQIISIDWSPNGYQLATSSEDNTVRIWDLRNPQSNYSILAHNSVVSCIKFQKSSTSSTTPFGYLLSSSFDNTLKLWSPNDWKPIFTLECHSSKVTSCDISSDNTKILSGSFDKTWKIWSV
ncbi:WD40 repeat-containing protein [Tieghemostelium lacteum]|uniref:WD40 repeat-containing protein n=1 Tax=Tieghemostelium lacteum TaxID=361077 RepID=A0A151Z5Z8_TIELA|nr:WD40 repeat-containing protein [Tieghemostelium lacteum]|eukprot:KYQ89358.1 WD40 repeat-containing protein [Tieghemostelium lacteum]